MINITATKTMTFDAGHRLSGYQGKCFSLHGHTYRLEITVTGNPDQIGMIIDFNIIKDIYKKCIEPLFDHRTILCKTDSLNLQLFSNFPPEWITWVDYNPTAENISSHILSILKKELKSSHPEVKLKCITLWETPTSYAQVA